MSVVIVYLKIPSPAAGFAATAGAGVAGAADGAALSADGSEFLEQADASMAADNKAKQQGLENDINPSERSGFADAPKGHIREILGMIQQ